MAPPHKNEKNLRKFGKINHIAMKPFHAMYNRYQRRNIAEETKSHFTEILEHDEIGQKVIDGIKDTTMYIRTFPMRETPFEQHSRMQNETIIRMHNGDTIDVALKLLKEGLRPCVLNFASAYKPGGGWLTGAKAQEEDLFLRTTYDLSLSDPTKVDKQRKWRYPIPEMGGIYSPKVFVFRDNAENYYRVLPWEECSYLDFVAVAAIRKPNVYQNRMSRRDVYVTREKIKSIFRIAALNNHNSLLLGAFGCGVYGNPPSHMAELFKEVLESTEFVGRFTHVDFAILDDVTKEETNYDIFKRILCPKGKEPVRDYHQQTHGKFSCLVEQTGNDGNSGYSWKQQLSMSSYLHTNSWKRELTKKEWDEDENKTDTLEERTIPWFF